MYVLCSSTISSKYGHFWLEKNKNGDNHNAKLDNGTPQTINDINVAPSTFK